MDCGHPAEVLSASLTCLEGAVSRADWGVKRDAVPSAPDAGSSGLFDSVDQAAVVGGVPESRGVVGPVRDVAGKAGVHLAHVDGCTRPDLGGGRAATCGDGAVRRPDFKGRPAGAGGHGEPVVLRLLALPEGEVAAVCAVGSLPDAVPGVALVVAADTAAAYIWVPPSMRISVPVMNAPSTEPSMATTPATVSGPAKPWPMAGSIFIMIS